jgi:hypothetical protein
MSRVCRHLFFLPLIFLAVFWLASCSSDDPVDVGGGGAVDGDIEAGIGELEDELYAMINSDNINSPNDMDFSAAKAHFEEAVRKNPANMDGHFGLSLTTVLALTADSEINAAFDEWETYLETHTPFQNSGKALSPLGVPLTFASGNRNMELPLEIMAQSLLIGMQPNMEVVEPSISRVQDIFRDIVIPALEESATHLGIVAEDPDYVFWVTPMMLGDAEEDSLELDRTEVLAAQAGVLLLTTACRLAVAYDLSFPSFDANGIVTGLDYNNGNMLRLRNDGVMQMNRVETDFLASVDALDAGITALLAETDPQDNDIIKTGPDDLSRNELIDFQNNDLPDVRAVFGDGLVLTEDWDGDYMTPDVELKINAHNFFNDPIPDWKKVLPPYTVSTREVEDGWHPQDYAYWGDSVQSSTSGYAEGGYRIWVENSQPVSTEAWGNSDISQRAQSICEMLVSELYWYSYLYDGSLTVSGDHDLVIGYNYVDFNVDYELVSDAPTTTIPHFTWEADTFEEWKGDWGNHNFNGLLPEIGTTNELFTLFGLTADGWEKEFDIDWTDLD